MITTMKIKGEEWLVSQKQETEEMLAFHPICLRQDLTCGFGVFGYQNYSPFSANLLSALKRILGNSYNCHLLVQCEGSGDYLDTYIKENGLETHIHTTDCLQGLEEQLLDIIYLPNIALGSFYFSKSKRFAENQIAALYQRIMEIISREK